jgi:hypothetical protein
MSDENKQSQAGGTASQAETSSAESDVSAPDAKEHEADEKASVSEGKGSTSDQGGSGTEEQKRPTRAQERIQELTGKLKQAKTQRKQSSSVPNQQQAGMDQSAQGGRLPWEKEEPLVKPGQELSPDEFTNIVNNKAAQIAELKVRQVLQQKEQSDKFAKAVDDWTNDAESLEREAEVLNKDSETYDPEIAESFSKLVERMNTDEKGNYIPKVKPSEVWEDFQKALKREGKKRAGQVSASLAKQQSESATPPTQATREGKDYESEEAYNQARQSGKTEDWAAYLKKQMFDKE